MFFNLIVITPEKNHLKEIEIATSLFESELKTLHVRKPNFTEDELRVYLREIPKSFYKKIVLHSHFNLANEFSLKGIHLTEKERKLNKKYRQKIISTSFHSTKEFLKSRRKYEYVFLSPIFDSISKANYKSNFSAEELKILLQKRKNVVALGGVNNKNIKTLRQLGFVGAAVLGAVWESKSPIKSYKELTLKIK